MGILSTFCVAVVALVLDRVCGAEPDKKSLFLTLWRSQASYVLLGSVFTAGAGALFYIQRSAPAWFYGQIALSIEIPNFNKVSTKKWYEEADSWATWIPYQAAFTALALGVTFYLLALLGGAGLFVMPTSGLSALVGIAVAVQAIRFAIYRHFRFEEDPIGKALPIFRRRSIE